MSATVQIRPLRRRRAPRWSYTVRVTFPGPGARCLVEIREGAHPGGALIARRLFVGRGGTDTDAGHEAREGWIAEQTMDLDLAGARELDPEED